MGTLQSMTDPQPPKEPEDELTRLERLLGERSTELPEPPSVDEIREKLDAVPSRVSREFPDEPELKFKRPKMLQKETGDSANYRGLGYGLTIAYALVGCMVAGFGVGWLIDRGTGGVTGQAMGGLVGSLVGIGFAFYLMNKSQEGQ